MEEMGVNVKLCTHAAQSLDSNTNDLAFFRSIMSLKRREAPRDSLELIACVQKAHDKCPANEINRMWLTLMFCMNEIIDNDGGNDYEIPHMGKEQLERQGRLPIVLAVTKKADKCS